MTASKLGAQFLRYVRKASRGRKLACVLIVLAQDDANLSSARPPAMPEAVLLRAAAEQVARRLRELETPAETVTH